MHSETQAMQPIFLKNFTPAISIVTFCNIKPLLQFQNSSLASVSLSPELSATKVSPRTTKQYNRNMVMMHQDNYITWVELIPNPDTIEVYIPNMNES